MGPFKRKPLNFLFFTDELKLWYFKYIVGSILCAMIVAGITIYIIVSKYTKIINVLGTRLPSNAQMSVDIVQDMMKNLRIGMVYIFTFEMIVLLILGFILSMYFAYKLMGPLKRIERETNEMASGLVELHPISIRKGDYLAPIIEVINNLIAVISKKSELVEEYKHTLKSIKTIIKEDSFS
ncbi:MAG: hypothetical protein ACK4JE_03880 [Endomicrobiia bacterium]